MKTVTSPPGSTTGIHPGRIKTLRQGEERFANYLILRSGNWTDYKRNLTDYNKALGQAKRESWRRHCEEIEKIPECARLHKILSKEELNTISSIQLENRDSTSTEIGTMEELL